MSSFSQPLKAFALPNIEVLLSHLARTRQLYVPTHDQWQRLEDATHFNAPEYGQNGSPPPLASAKSFFFQEQETILRFDGEQFVSALPDVPPFALFAINACDLQAIAYMDQFFSEDSHYTHRRSRALLIGVDCLQHCGGFCHEMGSGPLANLEQCDLALSIKNDSYYLIAASQAGEKAIANLCLTPLKGDWLGERNSLSEKIIRALPTNKIGEAVKLINNDLVDLPFWQQQSLQCVTCTGCTQVCPTCTCYTTVFNQTNEQRRFWDSCLLEGFQKEASGHNPGSDAGKRLHRFWQHKWHRDFEKNYGHLTCTGCGRCDRVCPGMIGAQHIAANISLYAQSQNSESASPSLPQTTESGAKHE